ncbi:hypothetical protein HPB52_021456 [Rhipicephalus sanguineus]|uniref:Uncharacterized protein n=1 Tax=Rhipicephalus sanguineus TaxID=34632 RepID=A0A9D4PSJ5_RHISA|nr:hypothetical protein HPB52_021456 [Rhipicephalus sanguineus]
MRTASGWQIKKIDRTEKSDDAEGHRFGCLLQATQDSSSAPRSRRPWREPRGTTLLAAKQGQPLRVFGEDEKVDVVETAAMVASVTEGSTCVRRPITPPRTPLSSEEEGIVRGTGGGQGSGEREEQNLGRARTLGSRFLLAIATTASGTLHCHLLKSGGGAAGRPFLGTSLPGGFKGGLGGGGYSGFRSDFQSGGFAPAGFVPGPGGFGVGPAVAGGFSPGAPAGFGPSLPIPLTLSRPPAVTFIPGGQTKVILVKPTPHSLVMRPPTDGPEPMAQPRSERGMK